MFKYLDKKNTTILYKLFVRSKLELSSRHGL